MGVSAGAVNAVHLASHPGRFARAVTDLEDLWRGLTPERIFRVDAPTLGQNVLRWGTRLLSGGFRGEVRSLLDTAPLRRLLQDHFATADGLLPGIGENVQRGVLGAVAISGASYSTGRSTVWAQGRCNIEPWTRPRRCGVTYPAPAEVFGLLLDAAFVDALDEDALRLGHVNHLLEKLPEEERVGFRIVDLFVMQPSRDLVRLAAEYERRLPPVFRFLTRGLGMGEAMRPDMLSLLLFEPDYVRRLIEIGEADAEQRGDELAAFFAR